MDTKRKVDESLALLNSLFAHPSKRHSAEKLPPLFSNATPSSPSPIPSSSTDKALLIAARRQSYKPPRPAVLDRLSRLAASRPTLHDSIAASIAASAPATQLVSATPTESIGSGTRASDAASVQTKEVARKRYMPWSRDQFHERLETFKPSTWFDKPKMVSAVECAKRGWINTSDDRLECCGGCGGIVIVRIDLESDAVRGHDATNTDGNDEDSNAAVKSDFDLDMDDFISEQDIEVDRAQTATSNDTEDDGMGQDDEDDTAFDVVQSHKWYCYWINPSYDQDRKEGWRIFDAVAQIKRILRGQIVSPSS
ncbi:hypothetical protein EC968_008373 [Mortierella alpina]|nr:hypothetical protein EC968_008373 [Mortierella alpina]